MSISDFSSSLSGRMRISCDHENVEKFPQNHVRFYLKYSSFVFKALGKPSFQRFLRWMLRKESIEAEAVRTVQVEVLPLRRENGRTIAGKCDPIQGRILIYPKTVNFCKIFKQEFGRNTLLHYAVNRARAALIHEILHLKYNEDERTVRELSEEYFGKFKQKQPAKTPYEQYIYNMIFTATPAVDRLILKGKTAGPGKAVRNENKLSITCLRASTAFR